MAAPDAPIVPVPLWLTDRSRYRLGTGRCGAARYLGYAFGPTGYGITTRADSLPLATGIYVHDGAAQLGRILLADDRLPTEAETREVIARVQAAYLEKVTARGFRGILQGPATDETIQEQSTLISGLLWVLRMKFLPWLHAQYRVLLIEQERGHVLRCTCGAGERAPIVAHTEGCQGILLMLKNDCLAQSRASGNLAYFEIKTTGWESDAWAEQWETDPQLAIGTLDLPETYAKEVTELYIVGLGKGSRKKDKYAPESEGPQMRRQQSALCYGYCRPGNPPLASDEWLPAWEWVDESGQVKRANKTYRRRGVWTLPDSDWATWRAYANHDPSLKPDEFWVRTLPPSVLDKICFVLGPMNRQDAQLKQVRANFVGEEDRWRETLWRLYEAQQTYDWSSDEFQRIFNELVPKSWNCRPFGKDAECEFVPICHRHEGWQDPLGSGRYVPRLPHHRPELDQAIARGLIVEQAQEETED